MAQFPWRRVTRTTAWVNLAVIAIHLGISVTLAIILLVNKSDMLVNNGDLFFRLFVRTVELATAFLLLNYSKEGVKNELALRRVWFWFYVNLTFFLLRMLFCYVHMASFLDVPELLFRFVSLWIVGGFIVDLKRTILNSVPTRDEGNADPDVATTEITV